jgi:hypothetical protein
MEDVDIFYGHLCIVRPLAYFMIIWYVSLLFGIFSSVLVLCSKKNNVARKIMGYLHEVTDCRVARHRAELEPTLSTLSVCCLSH